MGFSLSGCSLLVKADFQEKTVVFVIPERGYEQVKEWGERWEKATGLPIETVRVYPDPQQPNTVIVPFLSVDFVPDDKDPSKGICGHAQATYRGGRWVSSQWVEVDTLSPPKSCAAWTYVIGHEIMHAIGGEGHGSGGLSGETMGDGKVYKIDAEAILNVCEHRDCTAFIPEE